MNVLMKTWYVYCDFLDSLITLYMFYKIQGDFGDITSRQQLRKNLNCHSFHWFLKNIYPELFVPGEAIASGEVNISKWFNMMSTNSLLLIKT